MGTPKLIEGQLKKQIDAKMDDVNASLSDPHIAHFGGIIGPDQYDPEFCKVLIAAMRQGLDRKGAAGAIGISWETFEKWIDWHPEFAEAAKLGDSMSLYFWQVKGIQNLTYTPTGKQINSKLYQLNMAARFGWGKMDEESKKSGRALAFELTYKPPLEPDNE